MGAASARQNSAHTARLRHLVIPREHGAWGMLLVPLATGTALGMRSGHDPAGSALLLAASLGVFAIRTPVESLLGAAPMRARTPQERRWTALAIAAYGLVALASLAALLDRVPPGAMFGLGAAAAAGFAGRWMIRRLRPRQRCLAQMVGSAGLTATAAAGFYVAAGGWSGGALVAWGANWLFAANQIHYVQLRIGAAGAASRLQKLSRGVHFLFGEVVLAAVLVAAASVGALPWAACLAYVPLLARGVAWFCEAPAPLAIRRLGWLEMGHALVFGALLVALA